MKNANYFPELKVTTRAERIHKTHERSLRVKATQLMHNLINQACRTVVKHVFYSEKTPFKEKFSVSLTMKDISLH